MTTEAVTIGYARTAKDQIKTEIVYDAPVPAPIKKGDKIAKLVIFGPGVETQMIQLAAGANVGREFFIPRALYGARVALGAK